jgi:hypothetical protein|tara:strand:- start:218 stop:637 length:420 start_codon:yes stop_codon:yes gene_type:complete
MIFTLIPDDHALIVWPQVADKLEKATKTTDGRFDKMSILDELLERRIQLWVVYEETAPVAAITTRILQYSQYKALSIDWVGGSQMKEWLDEVLKTLRSYAKDQGCKKLEGRGRTGWKKILLKNGWNLDYVAYEVDISNE